MEWQLMQEYGCKKTEYENFNLLEDYFMRLRCVLAALSLSPPVHFIPVPEDLV
jgi:hypothetical protein